MRRYPAYLTVFLFCFVLSVTASANEKDYNVFRQALDLESRLQIYPARDKFTEAISLDTANSGYREHYAWFLHFNGFPEEAVAAFDAALALKPDDIDLAKGKAWNLRLIGRLPESLAIYRKVLPVKSRPEDMADAVAEVKELLAAAEEAKISQLKESVRTNKADAKASRELFLLLAYRGRFDESLSLGERLTVASPQDLPLALDYARVLSWSKQREKSIDQYNRLMAKSADNPFLMLELAQVLADAGRLEEALTNLQRARELMPGSARIARAEAEVLARLGRKNEAIAAADTIPTADNGLEKALARARSRHYSGMLDEAVEEYAAGLKSYPYQPELLAGMTESALYSGAPERAGQSLRRWKLVSPGDAGLDTFDRTLHKLEAAKVSAKFQYYDNSSRFSRINSGLSGELPVGPKLSLLADASHSLFSQSGYRDLNAEALSAGLVYRPIPKLEFTGRIGGNIYDRGDDSLTAKAGAIVRAFPGWQLAVSWDRVDIIDTEPIFGNALYSHVVTMGAVGSRIRSNEYSIYLQRDLFSGRLALSGKASFGDYSDGNLKQSRLGGISYRIFDQPRTTVGYQYFYLDYRDPAPVYSEGTRTTSAYYDPINFEVHTLFLDLSHQFTKKLRGGVEQRVSLIPKSSGSAYAVFGSLEADLCRSVSATLSYRFFYQNKGVDRFGTSGHFSAQEVLGGITLHF